MVRPLPAGRDERLDDLGGPVWVAAMRRPPDRGFDDVTVPASHPRTSAALEQ